MKRTIITCTVAALALVAIPTLSFADKPESASEIGGEKLSHINGVPIRVGEHGDFYYDYKRFNIAANPVGPVFGLYSISGSVAISNHLAIRGDLALYQDPERESNDSLSTMSIGATIYFKKMYSGFFVEPGLGMLSDTDDDEWDEYASSKSYVGPQVLAGWHWNWDSGLNVMAAFGAMRATRTDSGEVYNRTEVIPTGVFKVGYNF